MNKLLAEFFGTFWLVFAGCGSAVLAAGFAFVAISWVSFLWLFGVRLRVKNFARALWMRKVRIFARRIFGPVGSASPCVR